MMPPQLNDLPLQEQAEYLSSTKRLWDKIDLTVEENAHQRDKPLPYIKLQIDLLKKISGDVIVEVGSARQPLNHSLDDFNPICCNDGHSTFFWASTEKEVHTVDIANMSSLLNPIREQHPNTFNAYVGDGIKFLEQFDKKIDLLFLDAWDVHPDTPYAEKHLEAYNAAQNKLNNKHIIGIDDTDIGGGGKGRELVPHLLRLGYTLLTDGRQTIFINFDLNERD
jgi:hypothetical protein